MPPCFPESRLGPTQSTPWLTEEQLLSAVVSATGRSWLTEAGSLTTRLKSEWPTLAVQVLAEGTHNPWLDEIHHLALMSSPQSWLREVVLHDQHRPLVHARTVIPAWSINNPWQEVQRLGNRPLGELLFQWPDLERSPLVFSRFDTASLAVGHQGGVWARRCVFRRQSAPLLLTEFFVGLGF